MYITPHTHTYTIPLDSHVSMNESGLGSLGEDVTDHIFGHLVADGYAKSNLPNLRLASRRWRAAVDSSEVAQTAMSAHRAFLRRKVHMIHQLKSILDAHDEVWDVSGGYLPYNVITSISRMLFQRRFDVIKEALELFDMYEEEHLELMKRFVFHKNLEALQSITTPMHTLADAFYDAVDCLEYMNSHIVDWENRNDAILRFVLFDQFKLSYDMEDPNEIRDVIKAYKRQSIGLSRQVYAELKSMYDRSQGK